MVGVGRMGANMARRLKEAGYPVTALYDARPEVAAALAQELGSQAPGCLAGVTTAADLIITVVTDDKAQLEVFTNKKDNWLKSAAGKVFVNCATISPATHIKKAGLNLPLAAATGKQYQRMIDAGLGERDKSGIAELTFKGPGPSRRHKR